MAYRALILFLTTSLLPRPSKKARAQFLMVG